MQLIIGAALALQAFCLFNALYLFYPMPFALLERFFPADSPGPPLEKTTRLAVLIAAHNEESVLSGSLASLRAQKPSPGLSHQVFVVADNCHDGTAGVARSGGATVFERFSEGPSTKGQALAWLWSQLITQRFDSVVILDADNRAEPGFLQAIARALASGYPVVQGLRRAQPSKSPLAALDALTELCTHRVGAAGRRRMGLNAPIAGSGVGYASAIFDSLIKEVGTTLVEDCEWQAKLALSRTPVHWLPSAVILDEKTAHPAVMATQRSRWMAGRGQVARAYLPALLRSALGTFNPLALDMAAFLLAPPRVLTVMGLGFFFILSLILPSSSGILPSGVWLCGLAGFIAYVLVGLFLDDSTPSTYKTLALGLLQLPRFAWQMVKATWQALCGARIHWVATPHGREAAPPRPSVGKAA